MKDSPPLYVPFINPISEIDSTRVGGVVCRRA